MVLGIGAAGYRPAQSEVVDAALHEPVDIALAASRRIEIRVTDDAGDAVAGALLRSGRQDQPLPDVLAMTADLPPTAISNEAGIALVEEPIIPASTLLVTAPHHVAAQVTFAREATAIRVVLLKGVPLRGTVRDSGGRTVAAAVVEARCADLPPLRTLARSDGGFEFEALPRARCELVAARDLLGAPAGMVLDPVRGSASVDLRQAAAAVDLATPPSGRMPDVWRGSTAAGEGRIAVADPRCAAGSSNEP